MKFILCKTITETFLERVKTTPSAIGFQFKPTYAEQGRVHEWKRVSFRQFHDECKVVSFGLMSLLEEKAKEEKICILSSTRYEWSLADMAILGAKCITVPIYPSTTPEDARHILNHCEAKTAIVEDARQLFKILEIRKSNPGAFTHLKHLIVIEPSALAALADQGFSTEKEGILTLSDLKERGRQEEGRDPTRFEQNLATANPSDLITICYTSGTTGTPKGAMVTHENLMSVLEDCIFALRASIVPMNERNELVVLSFLPFSHILGKVESMAVYAVGFKQAFAENLDKLMMNMKEIRPTMVFAVPRIFEKAYTRILSVMDTSPTSKQKIFEKALDAGKRYYGAVWHHHRPSFADTVAYKAARAVIFSKISSLFGGRLKFAICGGAPLPKEIGEFFQILGIQVLEGYGLTETCAPISLNTPDDCRFGTVGRPLQDVAIKIDTDGEILIQSKKVFKGYFKMPRETEEVLENGWFRTGDIGQIDPDGFLKITDRKKDLIITSGGKNIAPQKIENLAKSQKIIHQIVVLGDRRPYLTALLTLEREQVIQYANLNQILFSVYSELVKHPKILSLIQKQIDEINSQLSSFETVKKFVILDHDFTIESGEMTPSLKVKRNVIKQRYRNLIDSLYEQGPASLTFP